MSILDQDQDKEVQFTPLTSLNIDADDCRNIRDFYTHFSIEMPAELRSAISEFESASSTDQPKEKMIELQNQLRSALCVSIISSNHPFFKDHLMDEIRSNAQQIAFLANFDEEVSSTLDTDNT